MEQPEAVIDGNQSPPQAPEHPTSTSIDWYSNGQSRTVEYDGAQVTVQFAGRKGRRGRIKIEAPAGAIFRMGSG